MSGDRARAGDVGRRGQPRCSGEPAQTPHPLGLSTIGITMAVAMAGCLDVEPPEGRLACAFETDCPSGWSCRADDRCWRTPLPSDGGVDALDIDAFVPDARSSDTGPDDASEPDSSASHVLVVTSPVGGRVVDSTPGGTIDCPGDCSADYAANTMVTLTALPAAGYRFGSWSDVSCGTSATCTVTMTSDRSIAVSWTRTATIRVLVEGTNATDGIVTSAEPAYTCLGSAASCADLLVDVGSVLTLDAATRSGTPAWIGARSWTVAGASCEGPRCAWSVSGDATVSVGFGQLGLLAFTTRAAFQGNLGGLTGADTSCNDAAAAAGLPGRYTAWLSGLSAATSAAARIPTGIGGWVRVDGRPFAASRAELVAALVRHPLDVAETGARATGTAWTGADVAGGASGSSCAGWTDTTSVATVGNVDFTGIEWTIAGAASSCNAFRHLYCLQTNPAGSYAAVAPAPHDPGAIVMFSIPASGHVTGRAGLAAFDVACRAAATAASLPGTYVAFVSTAAEGGRARSRLDGPVFRPDGWRVAPDVDVLTTSSSVGLETTLAIDATGVMLPDGRGAWTGFAAGGAIANGVPADTCADWTAAGATGWVGSPRSVTLTTFGRTGAGTCTDRASLYCIRER